jgi:hypothetical protein
MSTCAIECGLAIIKARCRIRRAIGRSSVGRVRSMMVQDAEAASHVPAKVAVFDPLCYVAMGGNQMIRILWT